MVTHVRFLSFLSCSTRSSHICTNPTPITSPKPSIMEDFQAGEGMYEVESNNLTEIKIQIGIVALASAFRYCCAVIYKP
ncbi:hypothetical protein B0T19DRAFT_219403 [Cercophora scortea]|uniref:Uncharacterized protein n=1 Tax=Cercophora scortea TaxID=314031 RepID=A0AAE0IF66_9PEZI|nr:hypothetical protein B0T19DRAFT_219403 [Cercophora scortea]